MFTATQKVSYESPCVEYAAITGMLRDNRYRVHLQTVFFAFVVEQGK